MESRRHRRQGSERGAAAGVEWGKGVFAQVKANSSQKEGSEGKWVISRALLGFAAV